MELWKGFNFSIYLSCDRKIFENFKLIVTSDLTSFSIEIILSNNRPVTMDGPGPWAYYWRDFLYFLYSFINYQFISYFHYI